MYRLSKSKKTFLKILYSNFDFPNKRQCSMLENIEGIKGSMAYTN